jgi:hypothetical protein
VNFLKIKFIIIVLKVIITIINNKIKNKLSKVKKDIEKSIILNKNLYYKYY